MIRIIQFLNEKNHFLEKFYSLNERQITRLEGGVFDDIEKFYNQREDLLKILKYVDTEIHQSHMSHKDMSGSFNDGEKGLIREALRAKEMYVKKILDQDLLILSLIDEAKSQIIKELQDINRTKKALSGYKSPAA